ncbi:MAG: Ig-like domain-containing protein, partial [Planctomycetaceae bacterium]|nr:Ig-like domain-containing protein [Planctomycetaceae bacterium]
APNIFEVKPETKLVSQSIKVYLDTTRVKGWNEIDAVQLVSSNNSRQWATKASASSTYATRAGKSESREITWDSLPPSVVKTVPQAGSTDVDPDLKEIAVTFSKDMLTDRMWAVVQISNETFPKTRKGIHYLDDKRTCVIPVDLEPGKMYVIWFNRGRFNSFRDTENNPAVPYLLVFKTKSK